MRSSPEIEPPPEDKPMSSPPPFPSAPPLQETPQPTTADPLEPAQSDHAESTPPPHPGVTATPPEAYESLVSAPAHIDGKKLEAGRPPSLPASPALEATKLEQHASPLLLPAVEACPEAATTEASPSPSHKIVAASVAETTSLSTPSSPPASTAGALSDESLADSAAMVSEEAARLPAALESMDANRLTAPAPPTPPLKSGPEGLLPQQYRRPPCSTVLPGCENFEHSQPPSPRPPQVEAAHGLPDAAQTDAIALTSEEPGAPSACKSDAEGSFEVAMHIPLSSPTEAESCSPEMAPPGFEKFKFSWPTLFPPNLSVQTAHSLLNPSAPEGVANPLPVLDTMDTKADATRNLPLPSLENAAEEPLRQPLLSSPSPITQAEPCSPDTPPPGFENFKLSCLLPPNENTYASSDVIATKAVVVTPEEAVLPVPALEAIDVETDSVCNLLPPLENKLEGLLKQPLLRSTTPVAESAPCSPEIAPPGFESFRLSWQPLSMPPSGTAYIMSDAAVMPLAVTLEEAAGSPHALEAMDVDMHTIHPLMAPLESGVEGSLQEPKPRPPSPILQDVPNSPDMAPPGFENFKSSQLLLPSPVFSQTAYILHDSATTIAEYVSEEATQLSPTLEAIDVKTETSPKTGAEGSLPQQLHRRPSPKENSTACSPEIVPSGHENLQPLPYPAFLPQAQTPDVVATGAVIGALDQVHHPAPVLGTIEEGTTPILSSPSKSGLLPQLEPQMNSVTTHAVDTPAHVPATDCVTVNSEGTVLLPPASQAMDANMDSATTVLPRLENGAEGSLPQLRQQSSSPNVQAAPCSLDAVELLPPPPPPFVNKEIGQMVCGSCYELIAYPRGAVHVQCSACRTINLVLEAHEVGNVHCGQCETLLMYPFGAPAVKCSLCLFVTEIGERNVRPRISVEQVTPTHQQELANQV
ncbi:Protein LOL5 [Hordeum vulgare]|nr:Protein LOL5 [Hordeum vulgare]